MDRVFRPHADDLLECDGDVGQQVREIAPPVQQQKQIRNRAVRQPRADRAQAPGRIDRLVPVQQLANAYLLDDLPKQRPHLLGLVVADHARDMRQPTQRSHAVARLEREDPHLVRRVRQGERPDERAQEGTLPAAGPADDDQAAIRTGEIEPDGLAVTAVRSALLADGNHQSPRTPPVLGPQTAVRSGFEPAQQSAEGHPAASVDHRRKPAAGARDMDLFLQHSVVAGRLRAGPPAHLRADVAPQAVRVDQAGTVVGQARGDPLDDRRGEHRQRRGPIRAAVLGDLHGRGGGQHADAVAGEVEQHHIVRAGAAKQPLDAALDLPLGLVDEHLGRGECADLGVPQQFSQRMRVGDRRVQPRDTGRMEGVVGDEQRAAAGGRISHRARCLASAPPGRRPGHRRVAR